MSRIIGLIVFFLLFYFLINLGLDGEKRPPADLVLVNNVEPQTIDPATMTGVPEGRICELMYEGLFGYDPVHYAPEPALTKSYKQSEDGKTYTFRLRNARWNNGDPICAQDFQYSWMRVALADNASQYGFMVNQYLEGADFFSQLAQTDLGDALETVSKNVMKHHKDFACTLIDKDTNQILPLQPFDGRVHNASLANREIENTTLLRLNKEVLVEVLSILLEEAAEVRRFPIELTTHVSSERITEKQLPAGCKFGDATSFRGWMRPGRYDVHKDLYEKSRDYVTRKPGWPVRVLTIPRTLTITNTQRDEICAKLAPYAIQFLWKPDEVQLQIPIADHFDYFTKVGVQAIDSSTLQVRLNNKVPYLLDLLAFHSFRPVHRESIEKHPRKWMRPENVVSNGPFNLKEWRIQHRMAFEKNQSYWDQEKVKLNTIDVLPVEETNTAFALYEVGAVHILTEVPTTIIPWLLENRSDFLSDPFLGTYFYRCNVTRKPMNNRNFRKSLNYALDKEDIVKNVSKAGELPATGYVPPGFPGYPAIEGPKFNPEMAKKHLALAKTELGEEIFKKPIKILYNTNENHKAIAERIQSLWQQHLGIQVELVNKEWKVYLDDQDHLNYDISRAAWIGDYGDPNTFLDMFITNGDQNRTGWSNSRYDELILKLAISEEDPQKRMEYLREAETLIVEELPVLPIYFYVTKDLIQPTVKGFNPNIRNIIAFKYLYF